MTQTSTRPRLAAHAGDPTRSEYNAEEERKLGTARANNLLSRVYDAPDVWSVRNPNASDSAEDRLLHIAEYTVQQGKHNEAAYLRLIGMAPEYVATQKELTAARALADREYHLTGRVGSSLKLEISSLRDNILPYNEVVKAYLDTHPNDSIDMVSGMISGAYRIMMKQEGQKAEPASGVLSDAIGIVHGMRAELATERLLGRFDDVDIQYHLIDDEVKRRALEGAHVDYRLTVTLLGHPFVIDVDIKANQTKTVDADGYDRKGLLWSRFESTDFIGNTTAIRLGTINSKLLGMQDALINQICLQHPGKLEKLCEQNAITLDDIDIN